MARWLICMKEYILAFDQSTQGTKAMLFDENALPIIRIDRAHKQYVNDQGWVEHNPDEIWNNVVFLTKHIIEKSNIDPASIRAIGISNQRETAVAWDRETGLPVYPAIVWQCARAKDICEEPSIKGHADSILYKTGLKLSPFFSAAKFSWILRNIPEAREKALSGNLCFGTVDSWLAFKMTKGKVFRTDYSNASRTQLFNIRQLQWDEDILRLFDIPLSCMPTVTDSDGDFGETDIDGILPVSVPVCGVMGDSHAALFGQGCLQPGMAKVTYGTGSSIMMQTGSELLSSVGGLVTSIAWKRQNQVNFVLEGNVNYAGAIISWLKNDVMLLDNAAQSEELAKRANPEDRTCLVPAFSGLGAPWWANDARAAFIGISRTTGRNELVKAALESIAYQISDIVEQMKIDMKTDSIILRADGGPTSNRWLMQFQSDILGCPIQIAEREELSCIGAAYMAGISCGFYNDNVLSAFSHMPIMPDKDVVWQKEHLDNWHNAIKRVL